MTDGFSARADADGAVSSRQRGRDLVELAVGYGLILLVIWTPRPWQRWFYAVAAVYLVVVVWAGFKSAAGTGLRRVNLLRSMWVVGLALVMAAAAVAVAAACDTLHPFEGPVGFVKRYWGYALWSFAQQILLQDFFLLRLLRLMPTPRAAVWTAASIFAIAHLPNPVLTVVTFTLGLAACVLFLRYRNLYPLAMAHAILGITIAITLPGPVIRNMRVGLGYITYGRRLNHHRSQSDHVVSTRAWVRAEAPTRRS